MTDIQNLVTLKRSKRARRVALRLDPVERVINLVIPERMSEKRAYSFARQHEGWVRDTLAALPQPEPFIHNAQLPIFGEFITLNIQHDETLKRTRITMEDGVLNVKTYQDDPTNRITAFLKQYAKNGLADMAQDKAAGISKPIKSVTVRDTKSRWGSCSDDGSLSFSWRLIFAPYEAIDYVVAHEVAHLRHMDHSKDFWKLCRSLSDDFVEGKYWMQNNGNTLMRYGKST